MAELLQGLTTWQAKSTLLQDIVNGVPPSADKIFGELEQAFAWGRKNAPDPESKAPANEEEGWTGQRKAVTKRASATETQKPAEGR